MNLLIAATDPDPAGWSWSVPGELVVADAFCDPDLGEHHDPEHDCLRSFVGMASGKAATLAQVAEVDLTREQLLEAIRDYWARGGGVGTVQELNDEADEVLADAEDWAPGTLLRRYKDELVPA